MGSPESSKYIFPDKKGNVPRLIWDQQVDDEFEVPGASLIPLLEFDPKIYLKNIIHHPRIIEENGKLLRELRFSPITEKSNLLTYLEHEDFPFNGKSKLKNNRIIYGDSLIGMSSLNNNGYHGRVQMIYFDPPYGIEFKANFKSGTIKSEGYLDSWKNGLGSYLNYLKKRLLLCQQLLSESGSIFVQIGDQNIHWVRGLLDEIFGSTNYINIITFRTAISTNKINNIADYLLWYAKNKSQVRRNQLFVDRPLENKLKTFTYSEKKRGEPEPILFKPQELVTRIKATKSDLQFRTFPYTWRKSTYSPPEGFQWKWNRDEMDNLAKLKRITEINGKLYGKRYETDFSGMILTNLWTDTSTSTFAAKKHYSVHTNPKVIRRCIAMTTRPGDLVLDPTSGSGTTAVVAEEMLRNWVVFDTSPSAILSTINWLTGSLFPGRYWNQEENDLVYEQLTKISLANMAKNKPSYNQNRLDLPKSNTKILVPASCFSLDSISISKESRSIKSKVIMEVLSDNGILTPNGTRYQIQQLQKFRGEIEDMFPKIDKLTAVIDGKEVLILFDEETLNRDYNSLNIWLEKQNWGETYPKVLYMSSNMNFLLNLEFLNGNKQRDHKFTFFYCYVHGDLTITDLKFNNHPESIYQLGMIRHNKGLGEKKRIECGYVNFVSMKWVPVPLTDIALWAQINKPPKGDKVPPFTLEFIQTPFYRKFMAKKLVPLLTGNEWLHFPNGLVDSSYKEHSNYNIGLNTKGHFFMADF